MARLALLVVLVAAACDAHPHPDVTGDVVGDVTSELRELRAVRDRLQRLEQAQADQRETISSMKRAQTGQTETISGLKASLRGQAKVIARQQETLQDQAQAISGLRKMLAGQGLRAERRLRWLEAALRRERRERQAQCAGEPANTVGPADAVNVTNMEDTTNVVNVEKVTDEQDATGKVKVVQGEVPLRLAKASTAAKSADGNTETKTSTSQNVSIPFAVSSVKRSDDAGPLEAVMAQMEQRVTHMASDIQTLKNSVTKHDAAIAARGVTYTRWGHASCPSSATLVYTGITAGSKYSSTGGAANHLCLTSHPVFDGHKQPARNGFASIWGSEYEISPEPQNQQTPACAVCRAARSTAVTVPGTNVCPAGWTREYQGYVMAGYPGHTGSSEYICVDSIKEAVANTGQNDNENSLYYTHAKCGALPCLPYVDDNIVTCVVCSR